VLATDIYVIKGDELITMFPGHMNLMLVNVMGENLSRTLVFIFSFGR